MKITESTVMKQRPYFQFWYQSLVALRIKQFFFQNIKNMNKQIFSWTDFLKLKKFGKNFPKTTLPLHYASNLHLGEKKPWKSSQSLAKFSENKIENM